MWIKGLADPGGCRIPGSGPQAVLTNRGSAVAGRPIATPLWRS